MQIRIHTSTRPIHGGIAKRLAPRIARDYTVRARYVRVSRVLFFPALKNRGGPRRDDTRSPLNCAVASRVGDAEARDAAPKSTGFLARRVGVAAEETSRHFMNYDRLGRSRAGVPVSSCRGRRSGRGRERERENERAHAYARVATTHRHGRHDERRRCRCRETLHTRVHIRRFSP